MLRFPRVWWFSLWLYPLWTTAGYTAVSHLCPSSQLAAAVNSQSLKLSSHWSPWWHNILLFTAGIRRKAATCVLQHSREQPSLCSLPILFPHQLFRASARGRTCCSLPAGTVTVAYGPLCFWRLNPFGTCHRCKSLLRHLFQCIGHTKNVAV